MKDQCIVERTSPRSETHFTKTQKTQDKIIMSQHFKSFTSSYQPNEAHLSTTTTTTSNTPISTITTTTSKPQQDVQVNQFELKNVKSHDRQIPTQIPFVVDETVEDLGIIKYPVPDILKKTKVFDQLQNRKLFLNHACKYSKEIQFKIISVLLVQVHLLF